MTPAVKPLPEIAACPNPECDPADYTDGDDFGVFETTWPITKGKEWHVECDCGYVGPRADTADEAIRLHNLICRPVEPVTQPVAQEPAYYFYHRNAVPYSHDEESDIVEARHSRPELRAELISQGWTIKPLYASPTAQEPRKLDIKRLVDRFLMWKLPEDFSPDAGISFKAAFNEHLPVPMKHEPIGTNLLDARQAEAMLRYVLKEYLEDKA